MAKSFMRLCPPAMIYLAISGLMVVYGVFINVGSLLLIVKVAFIALWTFLLNWLCSSGYSTLSWIILLFPIIMVTLMVLMNKNSNKFFVVEGATGNFDSSRNEVSASLAAFDATIIPGVSLLIKLAYDDQRVKNKPNLSEFADKTIKSNSETKKKIDAFLNLFDIKGVSAVDSTKIDEIKKSLGGMSGGIKDADKETALKNVVVNAASALIKMGYDNSDKNKTLSISEFVKSTINAKENSSDTRKKVDKLFNLFSPVPLNQMNSDEKNKLINDITNMLKE